jgi:hypothetical protein
VVIDTGPYAIIRHPGYVSSFLVFIGVPLSLGSLWALIPAILLCLLLDLRTVWEDETLREELIGYKEYTQQVRYRLVLGCGERPARTRIRPEVALNATRGECLAGACWNQAARGRRGESGCGRCQRARDRTRTPSWPAATPEWRREMDYRSSVRMRCFFRPGGPVRGVR